MESAAQVKDELLRLFGENMARIKYGIFTKIPYQPISFSNLPNARGRVEVAGYIQDLQQWFSPGMHHTYSYQGMLRNYTQASFKLKFERADYTVFSNRIYKDPSTSFDQTPLTADQIDLEMKALSGFSGLVTMRGHLRKDKDTPLLLVERIVGFEEVRKTA